MGVEDPKLDEDEAGETMNPACAVPTDGVNFRNIDSAAPSYEILGFRYRETNAR